MTIEDTDVPDKFSLSEAPAEGDGYYQAKTRQWVDLCPHLGPSDRTVLRVLTDLTTHASNRRKVSLDDLRGFVTTNPVALGEEPKPISASGLLRILRNLAALGQITADEDGTPLTFSSRKSAQPRAITMTIWRLPRHECGCHRNVFDALADVRGEEPRFEPARMDSSAVRRRTKRAGQKSNPGGSAGQKSNSRGQKSNPGGQKVDPHSQSDQPEPAPPITPPTTLSSSSGGSTTSPTPQDPGEEDDESPTAKKTPDAAETVMARTDATAEEAEDVLESIEAHAERNSIEIGPIARYVAGFADRDLRRHLKAVRAQRAPQARTGTPVPRTRTVCALHGIQGACPACRTELNLGGAMTQAVIDMYTNLGPDRERLRPDLATHPVITQTALTN